jgi:hypothetical protein
MYIHNGLGFGLQYVVDRVLGMDRVHPPTTCLTHERNSKILQETYALAFSLGRTYILNYGNNKHAFPTTIAQ